MKLRRLVPAVASVMILCAPMASFAQENSSFFDTVAARHAEAGPAIDYAALDVILRNVVYEVGPSTRQVNRARVERTGTRLTRQSASRYRYEGNRMMLHVLNANNRAIITSYREGMENIASQVDFAALTRDEQLAFWINLHNIVLLDEAANAYPTSSVSRIRAGAENETLHDARIINVGGTLISLRDIRENIVYANWDDPRVMYGFHTGEVGSPQLRRTAYTGANVWSELDANAEEFVNSLRGVEDSQRSVRVSPLYREHRADFFPNWPQDLYDHLEIHAGNMVRERLAVGGEPSFLSYDDALADLTNGAGPCTDSSLFGGSVSRPNQEGLASSGTDCGADSEVVRDFFDSVALRREAYADMATGEVMTRDITPTQ